MRSDIKMTKKIDKKKKKSWCTLRTAVEVIVISALLICVYIVNANLVVITPTSFTCSESDFEIDFENGDVTCNNLVIVPGADAPAASANGQLYALTNNTLVFVDDNGDVYGINLTFWRSGE